MTNPLEPIGVRLVDGIESVLYATLDLLASTEDWARSEALEADGQAEADNLEMNQPTHPYALKRVYVVGDIQVRIEENVTPEDMGGYVASVKHPPVARVTNGVVTVNVNPYDTELLKMIVEQMAAGIGSG